MRILTLICACVAMMVAVGGCATPVTPATPGFVNVLDGPGPYRFDCDAPGGKYKVEYVGARGNHLEVTGRLTLLAVYPDPRWRPTGNIAFANDHDETKAAFKIAVSPYALNSIVYEVDDGTGPASEFASASRLAAGSEVPFAVKLDHGIVSVTAAVAATKATASTKKPHSDLTRAVLSCSGAHVRFTDIVVTAP